MFVSETSLRGKDLVGANSEDWEKYNAEYEKADFEAFQSVGYLWDPTRRWLRHHAMTQLDTEAHFKNSIRLCQWLGIINMAGLVSVIAVLLKLL